MVEFLVREMEVKLEYDHLETIARFGKAAETSFNTSLTTVSPVFKKRKDSAP